MKFSPVVFVVALIIALLVGGLGAFAYLTPAINDRKAEIKSLKGERVKIKGDLDELEELTETDATKINGHMQDMFGHAEEIEEKLEENSLEGVEHEAEEVAEYAESISGLTPPKNKDQISTFKKMAEDLGKDSKTLQDAAKRGDLPTAKEVFSKKVEAGCILCHSIFRQNNEEIHGPGAHADEASEEHDSE